MRRAVPVAVDIEVRMGAAGWFSDVALVPEALETGNRIEIVRRELDVDGAETVVCCLRDPEDEERYPFLRVHVEHGER